MGYSSKYYDPQKAHEYYEKHKKLKGKTRKFNEKGQIAAKEVREQINAEKKAKLQQLSDQLKSQVSSIREALKSRLKGMSKEQKAMIRERVNAMIGTLRSQTKSAKEEVRSSYSAKLEGELDKIAADKSMVKTSKKKSSKK